MTANNHTGTSKPEYYSLFAFVDASGRGLAKHYPGHPEDKDFVAAFVTNVPNRPNATLPVCLADMYGLVRRKAEEKRSAPIVEHSAPTPTEGID